MQIFIEGAAAFLAAYNMDVNALKKLRDDFFSRVIALQKWIRKSGGILC